MAGVRVEALPVAFNAVRLSAVVALAQQLAAQLAQHIIHVQPLRQEAEEVQ